MSNQHIHTLVVNPKNDQIIYAGSTQGNVFISTDAGQHWAAPHTINASTSFPLTSLSLAVDPSGTKLYAATNNSFLVSTDNAQSWREVSPTLPTDSYTTPIFVGTKQMYLGTAHHGVYVSSDGGATWHSANGGVPSSLAVNGMAFDALQHRLWLASSGGIYRSDNGGASWYAMNTGLPNAAVTSVQPAASAGGNTSLVYAGTTKGFYISQDSGTHWTGVAALQYVFIRSILVDFRSRNAATVYVSTNAGAFRSDDSGQTWGGVGTGIPHDQAVYELVIGAKQASQLYAASNNVYLYPGSSGTSIDWTRVLSLLVVVILFVVLFLVVRRELRRHHKRPQPPEEDASPKTTATSSPPTGERMKMTSNANGVATSGAPRYRPRRGRGRRATRR